MKFKIKNYKVCLFIFIFISAVCILSDFSVCASKGGKAESKMSSALQEGEDSDQKDLTSAPDKSEKKSSDDLLKDILKDISEESLNPLLTTFESPEERGDFLKCVLDDIIQKKKNLKKFKKKIERCSKIIKEERTFVTIKNVKNLIAVGDLHGDSVSTVRYVKGIEELFKKNQLDHVVFLGDYVDRGLDSIGVLNAVIDLKLSYPNHVTLLRGNHETETVFKIFGLIDENSLMNQINRKYYPLGSEHTDELKETLLSFFDVLPLAADIDINSPNLKKTRRILAVHGGIPCRRFSDCASNELIWNSFINLKDAVKRVPVEKFNEPYLLGTQILWNDFECIGVAFENVYNEDRTNGRIISKEALENFCKIYNYDFIIRGHTFYREEPIHNLFNKCYTIFSASNYCRTDNNGAIAYFDYHRILKL